jgi:hypothetical protein
MLALGGLFSAMKKRCRNTSSLNSIISAVSNPHLGGTNRVGTEETYTLNFSRPGAQVIAQYYNFIRLGWKGYTDIARTDLVNARLLSNALEASGCNPPPSMSHFIFELGLIGRLCMLFGDPQGGFDDEKLVVGKG